MQNRRVKSYLRPTAATLLAAVAVLGTVQACTDLDESPTSTVSPSNYYRTEQEVLGGLAGVYSSLRSVAGDYWYASEASSDEGIFPTRGSNWLDNGKWIEFKEQTWTAGSAAAGENINGTFEQFSRGIARANTVLTSLQPNTVPNQASIVAELRALRAYYYYVLNDAFGGVPIDSVPDVKPRERNTRAEVFNYIERELLAVRTDLPVTRPASEYGRLTRGAVDAVLASLYLNAQVMSGEVTAAGLQPGPARWQDAANFADSIFNSGVYSLAADWRSNFIPNNDNSPENIFVVRFTNQPGLGLTIINRMGHYNHYGSPGGWNGFSTPSEAYNDFDDNDQRKQAFLIGPQVSLETGQPITDNTGNPLVLVPEIGNIRQAAENAGIRPYKFTFDPAHANEHMGNDYPVFRLAEIYLIKAEAVNELGRTGEGVDLVNTIRARVFNPPEPLGAEAQTQAGLREAILRERLFELNSEGKRRTDMIRMGVYTSAFQYKEQKEPYRILWPIPTRQIQTNPLLTQNAGY